jgi:DnaK suppressor protein
VSGTAEDADAVVAQVLADRRASVESEIATLQRPTDESGGISFGKRVGDGTSIAVERLSQVAASDRLQALLADVIRAQEKLAEGTYGVCDTCGQPIPPERLEALPWAVQCVTCRATTTP